MASEPDFSVAVEYHYGKFPPQSINTMRLLKPLSNAEAALGKYDAMLQKMHNNEILLAPLRKQEAVISSRMEGTISTLDEVLRVEAEEEDDDTGAFRSDTLEVYGYSNAMRFAQMQIDHGRQISDSLIKEAHSILLRYGRGAKLNRGIYKSEQNYLADRLKRKVLFVPISPLKLQEGMDQLIEFMEGEEYPPLINAAISHVEFESLHPFHDGNGRIGRMLITLLLWQKGRISAPHFYISKFFEENRDQYIELMRRVSSNDEWTDWIIFFLNAIEQQAEANMTMAININSLYDEMKEVFLEILSSKYHIAALDYMFSKPVFRNNKFTRESGIPSQTAARFSRLLAEKDILRTVQPAAGRRPALYAFEPLLSLIRI